MEEVKQNKENKQNIIMQFMHVFDEFLRGYSWGYPLNLSYSRFPTPLKS